MVRAYAAAGRADQENRSENRAKSHSARFSETAVYPWGMSIVGLVLLAAAVLLLAYVEWPRLGRRLPQGKPDRRKRHLRVVEPDADSDEFQRAVERDLANLPTYDPRAKKD